VVEQVAVLGDRARKDHEVDLTVVIDGHDAHDGHRLRVPCQQHSSDLYMRRLVRISKQTPTMPLVILRVQVSEQVDLKTHGSPPFFRLVFYKSRTVTMIDPNTVAMAATAMGADAEHGASDCTPAIRPYQSAIDDSVEIDRQLANHRGPPRSFIRR
jgi:hypothetical protein